MTKLAKVIEFEPPRRERAATRARRPRVAGTAPDFGGDRPGAAGRPDASTASRRTAPPSTSDQAAQLPGTGVGPAPEETWPVRVAAGVAGADADVFPAHAGRKGVEPAAVPGAAPGGSPDETSAPTDPPAEVDAGPAGVGPEELLVAYSARLDACTLRELVDDRIPLEVLRHELGTKIAEATDLVARTRFLGLRAVLFRLLGDLDHALRDGRMALAHAEVTNQLWWISVTQVRLARVHQWRGEYVQADRLFAVADSPDLPSGLRAWFHWYAATCCLEQGRRLEACNHLGRAFELGRDRDPALVAALEQALVTLRTEVTLGGWGPPRRSDPHVTPTEAGPEPFLDELNHRWGFAGIPPLYEEIRPFREGVAWVRRAGRPGWDLIDDIGRTIKGPFAEVGVFSGGIAWVSVDGSGWFAIHTDGSVAIATEYDDVRAFGRELAPVSRGGRWGAVDRTGRVVVPCEWDAIRAVRVDGRSMCRSVDGFTDDGLAVVERDGRKGVVDRTGRVIIEATYPVLIVSPTAFVFSWDERQWGAVDRNGRPLVEPIHRSPATVLSEVDRLTVEARTVL